MKMFYLDRGNHQVGIHICRDSSNYNIKMGTFNVCTFYFHKVEIKKNEKGCIGHCLEKRFR